MYVNEYADIKMAVPEGYILNELDLGSAMSFFEEDVSAHLSKFVSRDKRIGGE